MAGISSKTHVPLNFFLYSSIIFIFSLVAIVTWYRLRTKTETELVL